MCMKSLKKLACIKSVPNVQTQKVEVFTSNESHSRKQDNDAIQGSNLDFIDLVISTKNV